MTIRLACVLALAVLAIGCEGPDELIRNPDIDVWCGDKPCGWDVGGRIERVGTWHSHDYAVSFASDDARLQQANPDADDSIRCMSFTMIAKVSPGTKAFVELDFMNDGGEPEWSKQIPEADFEHFSFYVTPPTWFEGVRFIVRKEGPGEMVLAKLRAIDDVRDYERCTADPVPLDERPSFADCSSDDECLSGVCIAGECAGCEGDDDCESGVCGYTHTDEADEEPVAFNFFYTPNHALAACVREGSRATGSICLGDDECESGACCEGVCSECCGERACDEGGLCAPSIATVERDDYALPHQCNPGMGLGEQGAFCTADADCASGTCGERVCSGLCDAYYEHIGFPDCAKSDCDGAQCEGEPQCEIETVPVGRCH